MTDVLKERPTPSTELMQQVVEPLNKLAVSDAAFVLCCTLQALLSQLPEEYRYAAVSMLCDGKWTLKQ